ncbi:MAG: hypothetical protein ACLFWD_05030 [Anaerolineales bacterium]
MTTIEAIRIMASEAKDLAADGKKDQAIDLLAEGLEAAVDELISLNTQVAKLESQSEQFITDAGLQAAFSNYRTEKEMEESL